MHFSDQTLSTTCAARQKGNARGFTLIELMIVVAIIGILGAIALPAYQESVRASRRADLQRALGEAEQFMRRYYSAQDSFATATLPSAMQRSPRAGGGDAAYDIALSAKALSSFTITATRTGNMSNDKCGDLSIDQTGKRTQTNQKTGLTLADCFKGS